MIILSHNGDVSPQRYTSCVLTVNFIPNYTSNTTEKNHLKRAYHVRKIWDRKQRTDIGKCSFVNRTIKNWNQIPAETLGTFPCKPKIFKNRVRKAIINGVK
jgi:hypothetical protein